MRTSEQLKAPFRSSEQAELRADLVAADLFNQAVEASGLDNKEIAHLCGVSVSLVEKWRSREARGCPSFVQMLLLPPSFHIALHRALNRRFGFGRAALAQLMEAASALAVVVD